MTHLRETEFVDFAEGTLDAARAAHVDACAGCRAQAEAVAGALREAAAVEMPEPSPLFWNHFSARVSEAVASQPLERTPRWTAVSIRLLLPLVAAVVVVIATVSVAMFPRWTRASKEPVPQVASRASGSTADVDLPVDEKNAEVWDVLTAAASDMALDEAHSAGMGARPGAVDHAVTHLSQAELTELGRLLQTELKGSGH